MGSKMTELGGHGRVIYAVEVKKSVMCCCPGRLCDGVRHVRIRASFPANQFSSLIGSRSQGSCSSRPNPVIFSQTWCDISVCSKWSCKELGETWNAMWKDGLSLILPSNQFSHLCRIRMKIFRLASSNWPDLHSQKLFLADRPHSVHCIFKEKAFLFGGNYNYGINTKTNHQNCTRGRTLKQLGDEDISNQQLLRRYKHIISDGI
jgi:hypothetical protein